MLDHTIGTVILRSWPPDPKHYPPPRAHNEREREEFSRRMERAREDEFLPRGHHGHARGYDDDEYLGEWEEVRGRRPATGDIGY